MAIFVGLRRTSSTEHMWREPMLRGTDDTINQNEPARLWGRRCHFIR